jgi:microcin C transport system permease protein
VVAYFFRRLFLLIPTFIGITLMSFLIINLAPGGPVEQRLQQIRFGSGGNSGVDKSTEDSSVNAEVIEALKKQYGFDKPLVERYVIWLKNIIRLDFGESFTYGEPVWELIKSKFPVSLQFGILSLILTYLVCIPLGVKKALTAGQAFDKISGLLLYLAYSIPPLVLGILLIVVFAGSSYLSLFPIGGIQSDNFSELTTIGKVLDRAHHFVLPMICYMIGGFTELTLLTRNSMLDIIKSDYIRTARAKGLSESVVVFKHALRNALIPVATGLGGFLGVFLTGSLIVETIFNLDGIGLLSYSSILSRDYNVVMGLIFLSSMVLLVGNIISDIIYVIVDPRIDFK